MRGELNVAPPQSTIRVVAFHAIPVRIFRGVSTMITFRVSTDVPPDRQVVIHVPPETPTGKIELLVTIGGSSAVSETNNELAEAIAQLDLLDDDSLWRAAKGRLADQLAQELEALHLAQQREGLSDSENERRATLVRQVERLLVVRARAAALLRERRCDVSQLSIP